MKIRKPAFIGVLGAFAMSLSAAAPSLAIVNGNEPAETDRRFDAIAAFSRTDWLNGVTFEHNHFCNGTLISPDTMVLAKHCVSFGPDNQPPSGTFTFRFRRNPDGSLGEKSLGWESFHHVAVTHFTFPDATIDVLVAHLAEPVTHIKPIRLAEPLEVSVGDPIIVAGWGKEGPGFNQGPRGRLLLAKTNARSVSCYGVGFRSAWDSENPCGCGPNNFDSGGAVLIERRLQPGGVAGTPVEGTPVADVPVPVGDPVLVRPQLRLLGVISTTAGAGQPRRHQFIDPCYNEDFCTTNPCPWDLDDDGIVGSSDLAILLSLFGECPCGDPCDAADFNNDEVVNSNDLSLLLGAWGPCP